MVRFALSLAPVIDSLSPPMPRRGAFFYALLVFLAGASLIREAALGRLARVEEAWTAWVARVASPTFPPSRVTLVEINEDTMGKHDWPWAPDDFAVFFHAVLPFEPAVIALGEILDFDRSILVERDPVYERMLKDHVLRTPKLVLAGRLAWSQDPDVAPDLKPMPVLRKVTGDMGRVPEFSDVGSWAAEEYRVTTQPGWTNLPDDLGTRGRCPLILRYRGQPVPGIVLQLAMHVERVTLDEVEVVLGSHVTLGNRRTIPIDDAGRMAVNFGASFARVSFDDLLLSREQLDRKETPVQGPELFKDRVVILARTDPDSSTLTAPGNRPVSPAEVFAAGLATLGAERQPARVGGWFDWLLVAVASLSALWLRKWKPLLSSIIIITLVACYVGAALWVFRSRLITVPGLLMAGLAVWLLLLRSVARRIEKVIAF